MVLFEALKMKKKACNMYDCLVGGTMYSELFRDIRHGIDPVMNEYEYKLQYKLQ